MQGLRAKLKLTLFQTLPLALSKEGSISRYHYIFHLSSHSIPHVGILPVQRVFCACPFHFRQSVKESRRAFFQLTPFRIAERVVAKSRSMTRREQADHVVPLCQILASRQPGSRVISSRSYFLASLNALLSMSSAPGPIISEWKEEVVLRICDTERSDYTSTKSPHDY